MGNVGKELNFYSVNSSWNLEFKISVFKRDNFKCVICGSEAKDAHHIIDRKLFRDESQGYYLDNGASLCHDCHYKAETTEFTTSFIREKSKISNLILPEQFEILENFDFSAFDFSQHRRIRTDD